MKWQNNDHLAFEMRRLLALANRSCALLWLLILSSTSYSVSIQAQSEGDAFYIYRNGSVLNAFFRAEVDSMTYSSYDLDGLQHSEVMTQVIYTQDSIYRIPIASIDSISFDVNRITVSNDYVALTEYRYVVEEVDTLIGKYVLAFEGNVPMLHEGNVISIANDTLAQIVRITGISHLDESRLAINFRKATLGEVFTGGSFTLSTMDGESGHHSRNERTYYPSEISFYDMNGQIHSIRRTNRELAHNLFSRSIDFSGKDLHKTEHTRLYIETCRFDMDLDLVISCNFSNDRTNGNSRNIGSLELLKSGLRGTVNTDFMIRFDANGSKKEQSEERMLKANIHKPVVATFVVAGVPIAVVMNTHLFGEISYDVSGEFSAHTGHRTSTAAEIGLSWSKAKGVKPYGNLETSFEFHKPAIEGKAHLESKLCIFPRITFSLYGIIGPTFDLKPYLRPVIDFGFYDQIGRNREDFYGAECDLFGGYDAAVGISEFSVTGRKPIIMSPSWNVIEKMLLEAPKKIEFASSKPDALILGQTMKVAFHAMDYDYIRNGFIDAEYPFPVKFETNSGTLSSDFALVDPRTGLVSIDWTPDAWKVDGKDAYILAKMYTPDGYVKTADRWTPTIIEVNPEAFVNVLEDDITSTSARLEYGFHHVPKDAICYVAVQSASEDTPAIFTVQSVEKDTLLVSDLWPGTTYTCWGYVEYMGKTYTDLSGRKSFVTLTPAPYVEKVEEEKVTTNSAEITYGFANVPEKAKCYIGIRGGIYIVDDTGEEIIKRYSQTFSVEDTPKGTYEFTNLYPSATYTYYTYVEYEGETWYSDGEEFTTKAPPTPIATTGSCSNVTTKSATVSCIFEDVPEGGVCGVEYTWNNGSKKQSIGNANGAQTITLSGLVSGTTYTYCAYVEAYGQTYYGSEKTFTTQVEIPDLTGTWNCDIYKDDGSVLESPTLTLTSDGKATVKGSSFTSGDCIGGWSIDANGKVGIYFKWTSGTYNPTFWGETYSGTVNSMNSPSAIEGTVSRRWSGIGDHGNSYTFKMTR